MSLAVHEEHLRRARRGERAHPVDDLLRIRVRRKSVEHLDLRLDRDLLAEDAHALDAVDEPPPEAPLRLIADEEHGRFGTP